MTIEIVDFPIKNGGSFHSYVKLPEGNNQDVTIVPSFPATIRRRYSGYVDAVIQRWALVADEYLRRRQESEARLVEDILNTNKYIIVSEYMIVLYYTMYPNIDVYIYIYVLYIYILVIIRIN